jgi:hypothetical protein
MPRLLKRFKEFEDCGQLPPTLIEADFICDFVVALQRTVRDTPGVLKQFGATLNGLIRCLQNTFTSNQRGSTVGLHATTSMLTLTPRTLLALWGAGLSYRLWVCKEQRCQQRPEQQHACMHPPECM